MPSITQRITIQRPPAAVFAFIGDYRNDPQWRSGVVEIRQMSPGPIAVGATTHEVMRFLGRPLVTLASVTEYDPGRRLAFKSTGGPIPVRGYRLVEEQGEETRFTYHLSADLPGRYRLLEPLIMRDFRRRVARDLQHRKALLEQK